MGVTVSGRVEEYAVNAMIFPRTPETSNQKTHFDTK